MWQDRYSSVRNRKPLYALLRESPGRLILHDRRAWQGISSTAPAQQKNDCRSDKQPSYGIILHFNLHPLDTKPRMWIQLSWLKHLSKNELQIASYIESWYVAMPSGKQNKKHKLYMQCIDIIIKKGAEKHLRGAEYSPRQITL